MKLPKALRKFLGMSERQAKPVAEPKVKSRRSPIIVNPIKRKQLVDSLLPKLGDLLLETRAAVQLACTPVALHGLKDHSSRGKKSLTRIASLRMKERQRCGRGKKNTSPIGGKVKVRPV